MIPESEGVDQEAQVNAAILTEDPDQSPEEPKADLVSDYREGKPGHKPNISNYTLYILLISAFTILFMFMLRNTTGTGRKLVPCSRGE